MEISTQLTAIRQHLGLTREDFAEMLGFSIRTLANYESGSTAPYCTAYASYYLKLQEKEPALSVQWWFLGTGGMLSTEQPIAPATGNELQMLRQMLADKETIITLLQQKLSS